MGTVHQNIPSRLLQRWVDELGQISDEQGRLTRTFLSPAMQRANSRVGEWMRQVGLQVEEDAIGNLRGRLASGQPDAKTLLFGSHLDTVRDAGRFDGALGVLLPIVALGELRRRRITLPFTVEVIGFAEEEGVRFSSAYLGSKAYTGQLRPADLALRDADGVSVRDAIHRWRGLTPNRVVRAERLAVKPRHRGKEGLLGYVETHIEQGPILEARKLAVGAVSAIAGQTRGRLTFRGQAGHAGTTPMALRRDALAGAAEFVLLAERRARVSAPLVATVGTAAILPGAPNVIPGQVVLSLDVRHPRDAARRRALRHLIEGAKLIAGRRHLACRWEQTQDNGAVTCSAQLTAALEHSIRAVQGRSLQLVSGAGHDAVVMSALTPVAMLFVRCRGGLSHHPDEFASPRDLGVALNVVLDFLQRLATSEKR